MDLSYLIVSVDTRNNIDLYCFFVNGKNLKYCYPTCFTVSSHKFNYIFDLVSLSYCFNILSTSHKVYIGTEIFKAYIASKLVQCYIQE